MPESKERKRVIKLQCSKCKRFGYYTHKNKKTITDKLKLKKHCKWCRVHTLHEEAKK